MTVDMAPEEVPNEWVEAANRSLDGIDDAGVEVTDEALRLILSAAYSLIRQHVASESSGEHRG